MRAFGLLKTASASIACMNDQTGFTGLGFGHKVPVDIVVPFLAGLNAKDYYMLLVDEFYRFNGVDEGDIQHGLKEVQSAIGALGSAYDFRPRTMLTSDFMSSGEYRHMLAEAEERTKELKLHDALLRTVPERYVRSREPLRYPLNEIACIGFFFHAIGAEVKLGPEKEMPYDELAKSLGIPVNFAYFIDAYALGSRMPETVVHYVPTDRGPLNSNGQRLFLDDPDNTANSKLLSGPDEASRYLLELASAAGHRLGKPYLTREEIKALRGKRLRKSARHFVFENVLKPYREAIR